MIYGYARCSTNEEKQDIDRQIRDLKKMGAKDETIFFEFISGAKVKRPQLQRLLDTIAEGDTICCTEVSRITRSTAQLCDIIGIAKDKKLKLVLGSMVLDCTQGNDDAATKAMLMMWAVFAEMERDMISERVKSGIANAKAKGKIIGRPTMTATKLPTKFLRHYSLYTRGEISKVELAELAKISRQTVYNYIKIMENSEKIKKSK